MINFGSVPAGSVLPIPFCAYNAAGASLTLTGLAVTDIEVYKGISMTQRASDAGYVLMDTDGIDIDGVTGLHGFSIDTGDNTDASFYAVGSFYSVVVSAVTIDSQTVSFIAATFRLMAAEAVAGKPKADVDAWLGTAAATPTVAGVPEVDVTHWIGTAAATPTTAGVPEVDVTHWTGVATVAGAIPAVAAGASGGLPTADATNSVKVQSRLKKNTALANFRFVMTDSTTDNPATGKTVTVTRGIDGSAHSAGTLSAVSEIGNGEYRCDFAAADLNGNIVSFRATASGCNDLIVDFFMEP